MKTGELKLPGYMKLVAGQENVAQFNLRMPLAAKHADGKTKIDLQSFKPESKDDLRPSPDDYIKPVFRAISAAYLGELGYYLDFTKPGVLQDSMPLLLPQEKGGARRQILKFHRNHSNRIEDIIGWIEECYWSTGDENMSAPGINVGVMIDWKLAPNESRQLLSKPPLVESVSLSVIFKFEKSHPELEGWRFYDLLGHEVDGKIVRLIVTEIVEYNHLGLVHEGADEEADMLEENREQKVNGKTQEANMDNLVLAMNDLKALTKLLGVKELGDYNGLYNAVEALANNNLSLQDQVNDLKAQSEQVSEFLAARRTQVLTLLDKLGEKAEGLRKVIVGSNDLEMLAALETEYATKLDEKFPLICQKCGEKNLARRSSVEEPPKEIREKTPPARQAQQSTAAFKV